MTAHNDDTELGWLAFQYVTDELSDDAVAAFESRLAEDQNAREALAEAVLLSQALLSQTLLAGAGETVAPASRRFDWSGALVWAALGAAACLAVIVGGSLLKEPQPAEVARRHVDPPAVALAAGEGELALAWANAYFPSTVDDEAKVDDLASLDDDASLAGELEHGVSVPNWMVEAVRGFETTGDASGEREES